MVIAGGVKLAIGKKGPGGGGQPVASANGPASKGQNGGGRGGPGGRRGGGAGPTMVSVSTVEKRPFINAIEVLGVAKGRQSVTLSAATTQLVQKVNFHDGQSVPRGAVLVELKNTEQGADLAQARAKQVEAERAYQRWRELSDKGFASKASLDQYEAAYLSAKADVAAAEARQADRMIRAPFSGVVGLSDIAPGALVNPGAAIVTLDDLSGVRVDFPIPERFLPALHEGQTIYARSDAYPGDTIQGRIAKLDTRIDERTRAITARAEFPNPQRKLKPGMLLRVSISRGQRTSLAVPEAALSVQGDESFVYVVHPQNGQARAERVTVDTGDRQEGYVEILQGVREGDQLIADGLNKIQPGQPVTISKLPPAVRTPHP